VHRDLPALRTFGLSLQPQEGSTNVVPLLPLVTHAVFGTLAACDAIMMRCAGCSVPARARA
jgi:hypothetical protein